MRNFLAFLFLAVALCACAAYEPHTNLATSSFTRPQSSAMPDEQTENFFEGNASPTGVIMLDSSAAQQQLQPPPPSLR